MLIPAPSRELLAAPSSLGSAKRRSRATQAVSQGRSAVSSIPSEVQTSGYLALPQPQVHALPMGFVREATRDEQERSLREHAEKRALAELLRRGSDDLSIRISFKVCADCHLFLKSAAALFKRRIRVHEPSLLHDFDEGGDCSCKDEWKWQERQLASRRDGARADHDDNVKRQRERPDGLLDLKQVAVGSPLRMVDEATP